MKRSYIHLLLIACATLSVRCTDRILVPSETPIVTDPEELPYTSYWYYTYEASEQITYASLDMEAAAEFNPAAVADRGDTLFVGNSGTAGNSLILYSKKARRPLRTIKTWTVNGAEKNFTSKINTIFINGDRLYVDEQQSLIHVFSLPDMEYYSCIGNGAWQGPVFQAQAMTITNGLIFARDKPGNVSVYKEELVTPENYQKINRYKQAGPGAGNTSNNGFAAHYMEVDKEGHIMLTAYEAQSIRVLDPSLIDDNFKNGTNIDIADRTWALSFKPKTFATTADRLYVTGSNDVINIYDFEQKEWVKTLKTVKGFTFQYPERIYRENDETFWVSDIGKCTLVKLGVFKGEIREYEHLNERIVRVKNATTRSGEEAGDFYVDLRTHEIVDPADVQ